MEWIMSIKHAVGVMAVATGLLTFGTQAMALNPQPLPPRWSQATITSSKSLSGPQAMARKAGGDPQSYKVKRSTGVGR
jgi:hypothetical protein